jgi:hypothetical protein
MLFITFMLISQKNYVYKLWKTADKIHFINNGKLSASPIVNKQAIVRS